METSCEQEKADPIAVIEFLTINFAFFILIQLYAFVYKKKI